MNKDNFDCLQNSRKNSCGQWEVTNTCEVWYLVLKKKQNFSWNTVRSTKFIAIERLYYFRSYYERIIDFWWQEIPELFIWKFDFWVNNSSNITVAMKFFQNWFYNSKIWSSCFFFNRVTCVIHGLVRNFSSFFLSFLIGASVSNKLPIFDRCSLKRWHYFPQFLKFVPNLFD